MKQLQLRETYYSEIYEGREIDKHLGRIEKYDENENLVEIKSIDQ